MSSNDTDEWAIEATNITKSVELGQQRLQILGGANLRVEKGSTAAILGASGSGKTTLLGILAGLDTATSGSVSLMGQSLGGLDESGRAALRAKHVGFVFQNFQLMPSLSALENVMLPIELKRQPEAQDRAAQWLGKVGLSHRLGQYPAQLSGGEQQRVAIARAFAAEPALLFADEPTGNLDTHTGADISELLFELNAQLGTTLVLVTHDQHLASRCREQWVLEEGELRPLHDTAFESPGNSAADGKVVPFGNSGKQS